jgi:hypothetical protein
MAYPKPYLNAAGDRVPSVTTILSGLGWSKDSLMYWAWKQGQDGKDFRETRDTAASIGTTAHAMVQAHIHGRVFEADGLDEEIRYPAAQAFSMYREWEDNSKAVLIASELRFVSEKHQFGGGPDALMMVKRGLSLPDWKTGGVYSEHILQVAAYVYGAEEILGERLDGGAWLFRFKKDAAGFDQKWIAREALRPAWSVFLRLRDIYEQRKAIEALAK